MVKFNDTKHHEYTFSLLLTDVSANSSPFKELLGDEYEDITFSNDNESFKLESALRLKVKMHDVGEFIFFLYYQEEKMPEAIEQIKNIKDPEIDSLEGMIKKTEQLFKVMENFHPLFVMYLPYDKYPMDLAVFKTINAKLPIFNFVESTAIAIEPKQEEEKPKEKVEESTKEKKEAPEFLKVIGEFFLPVKKYYLHFLFVLISALLTGFAASVGVFNSFDNKPIAIFFYVCAAVGTGLNGLVNFDTFKGKQFKKSFYVLTGIASLLGVGIAMGGFMIFYISQQSIPETIPSPLTMIAISLVISLIILAGSTVIGILLSRREKQKDDDE